MRYMEMANKEIVNITDGSRLGILGQTDLAIDQKTGKIQAIIVPHYHMFGFKQKEEMTEIKWRQVKKVGKDLILVEFSNQEG